MRKPFTLIELLVMVAILAVLASMLMPALNKVKSASDSNVCSARLKGLGIAAQFYADDNEDIFVISYGGWWTGKMYSGGYLEVKESVMTCPSLPLTRGDWLNGYKFHKYHTTYGVAFDNRWKPRQGWHIIHGTKEKWVVPSEVKSPNRFFFYADTGYSNGALFIQRVVFTWHQRALNAIHTRHNNHANLWFLDGHVEGLDQYGLREFGVFGGWAENQTFIDY